MAHAEGTSAWAVMMPHRCSSSSKCSLGAIVAAAGRSTFVLQLNLASSIVAHAIGEPSRERSENRAVEHVSSQEG